MKHRWIGFITLCLFAVGSAHADLAVPAQAPSARTTNCNLVNAVMVGQWDLTGDGRDEYVYFYKMPIGGYANSIVVVNFNAAADGGGCFFYPLETASTGDPQSSFTVEPVQMDAQAGDELVIRPRPYLNPGSSTPQWKGVTHVIRQSQAVWYYVDYTNGDTDHVVTYQNFIADDINGRPGNEIAGVGLWTYSSPGVNNSAYLVHSFSLRPSPRIRSYNVSVARPDNGDFARPPYKVLSGQIGTEVGDEIAVIYPPLLGAQGWVNGAVEIINDREGTRTQGIINGYGSSRTDSYQIQSATIANGHLTVVVAEGHSGTGRTVVYTF